MYVPDHDDGGLLDDGVCGVELGAISALVGDDHVTHAQRSDTSEVSVSNEVSRPYTPSCV